MALFLTEEKVRSKPFIKRMFKCITPGSTNPNDRNWTDATYISKKLENGFNASIEDAESLIWMITPFVEYLFQLTFYEKRRMRDYALGFSIQIRTENELVRVGEFYFRSDRNPFRPRIEGLEFNQDLSPYLEHSYKILVTTEFIHIYARPVLRFVEVENNEVENDEVENDELENDEESVPPKPIEKTFKSDQCVICLEEEPNVLFCNCGHICICEKCASHRYNNCPVCKKENTILRIIE